MVLSESTISIKNLKRSAGFVLFECRVGLRIFQGFNLPSFFSVFFRGGFPHVLHVIKAEWLWVKKNSRSLFNCEKVKIKNLFVLLRATKNSTNISAKNRRFLDGEFVENNKTPCLICLLLCLLFTVPLENILVIRWRHNCRWKAKNLCRYLVRLLNREGCLSCHTCCDRGSQFFEVSFEHSSQFCRLLRQGRDGEDPFSPGSS